MDKKTRYVILSICATILIICGIISGIFLNENKELNNTIDKTLTFVENQIDEIENTNKVVVTDEMQKVIDTTIAETTMEQVDYSTQEEFIATISDEEEVTDEGAESDLEIDAVIEQENISYDGSNSGKGLSLLGAYNGITYFSQADSRWADYPYTSIGDSSQTMKSSACGPTSASMVISSSKGTILPTVIADLFVKNGYRTANSGTAWSAFPFVADYFDFNEYCTTSNLDEALEYLGADANHDGISDYFVIASCGSGLFTTGGHYITLVDLNGATITVYDPYLYSGKFNTASRRNAGVIVDGNSAYVNRNSFARYGNAKNFFIFSNDRGQGNPNDMKLNQMVLEDIVDLDLYHNLYVDLQRAFNGDKAKLLEHVKTYGIKEGRIFSYQYNPQFYKAKYADLQKAFGNNWSKYWEHYCLYGVKEGRQASKLFDVTAYKKRYADLSQMTNREATIHFQTWGKNENRQSSNEFYIIAYKNYYLDLQKAFKDNLNLYYRHYIIYGEKENRKTI